MSTIKCESVAILNGGAAGKVTEQLCADVSKGGKKGGKKIQEVRLVSHLGMKRHLPLSLIHFTGVQPGPIEWKEKKMQERKNGP